MEYMKMKKAELAAAVLRLEGEAAAKERMIRELSEADKLTEAEKAALRRIMEPTGIIENADGLRVCGKCGQWQGGTAKPNYCHQCGRPIIHDPCGV